MSRQERVRQYIATLVTERGANQRLASLARQGAEGRSGAARVRVERGKLRAPLWSWVRRQLLDASCSVSVVRFSAGMIAVHPPLELLGGVRHTVGTQLGGQYRVAEGMQENRVRLPQ